MRRVRIVLALTAALLVAVPSAAAQEDDPVVHAVLFFSPTCGHCEYVIQQVMPPLFDQNGGPWEVVMDEELAPAERSFYLLTNGSLEFLLADVTVLEGAELFQAATDTYGIDSNGVPRMIIDGQVYIGSADIPEALSSYIADGLAGDGVDWPDFPGLDEAIASFPAAAPPETTSTATSSTTTADPGTTEGTTTSTTSTTTTSVADTTTTTVLALPIGSDGDSIGDRFARDAVGNTLAVIVLVLMLAALGWVALAFRRTPGTDRFGFLIPIVSMIGIAVAAYLTYVETSGADAVCGPVGDCNMVQQSEYAELFGLIPVGVVGLIGYAIVVVSWLVIRFGNEPLVDWARLALLAGAIGGVAFSIYLTFLEPFVIGATCVWCLTSAVVITVLMLLATPGGVGAFRRLR